MKIGLYFGSFNPIHIGHLIIANCVLNQTDIQRIWFVVSPQNPFKNSKTLLSEYQRLHLVRIAIEDNNLLKATDIEFKMLKPSYTINTITYLKEKYPANIFSIIMGSDSYKNLDKWKNYEEVQKNEIIIYNRSAHPINRVGFANHLLLKHIPQIDISATTIRKMISEGKSIKYLVPDKVIEAIESGGYYKKK